MLRNRLDVGHARMVPTYVHELLISLSPQGMGTVPELEWVTPMQVKFSAAWFAATVT